MAEADDAISVQQEKNVLVIKFNRPYKKNAFNNNMYIRLTDLLNAAAKNDEVAVTVLTGVGDFYSSGNDLTSYLEEGVAFTGSVLTKAKLMIKSFVEAFITFPKILIAVVNGPAIGIAATTLALCDIVYASREAFFSTPFTRLGMSAEGCSTYTFPKLLGNRKAAEMLLFNEKLSSTEALHYGFINEIFSSEDINTKAWDKIFQYASLPRGSLLNSKRMIKEFDLDNLILANQRECDQLEERWNSEEFMQAIIKFVQKNNKSKI